MRAFIAIKLPPQVKDSLARIQNQLKESGADVRWVEPGNIHLTLKFLGEIDDKQLGETTKIIEDAAANKPPFKMLISHLGAFPRPDSPRVIWVGVSTGDGETKELAEELEERIQKCGVAKEERAFSSHITIGRTRSAANRDRLVQKLKTCPQGLTEEIPEFEVTGITLFKSTLTPKGPIYEVLKEASLKTT